MFYNFGVVKELKEGETRVSLSPDTVSMLTSSNYRVIIESNAGLNSGFLDEDYIKAGAKIVKDKDEVWENSSVVVKVKEPQKSEYKYFRPNLAIFSYFHLAVEEELANELLNNKVISIASESIQTKDGHLPLLTPMSQVAGRLAVQMGSHLLEHKNGGSGVLLSGVPGVQPGKVIIIGGGSVGFNAAQAAIGMGADVSIFDINPDKLVQIDRIFGTSIKTHYCNPVKIAQEVPKADLLITSVLIPSNKAPKIVSEEVVKTMKKGSVIIDVAIDQGGNVETSDRITSHNNPTYLKHGILHCTIPNIPSAVPRTSSYAYSYAMYPYLKTIGELGLRKAIFESEELKSGVNTYNGEVTNKAVASSLNKKFTSLSYIKNNENLLNV